MLRLPLLALLLLPACSSPPSYSQRATPDWTPPGANRDPGRENVVESGWPFPVNACISDADFGNNPYNRLREHFLKPISQSPHASLIESIDIQAIDPEGEYRSCEINLKKPYGTISLTHIGSFYNSNDPHLFDTAARCVTQQLDLTSKPPS